MSLRRHWLDRLTSKLFGSANRSRRRNSRPLPVEALEVRQYLSASMTLLNEGHTLSIAGDSGDNDIAIVQDERGVHVMADGAPAQSFTGIERILVSTGLGNDDVRVIHGFNPQPDPPGDQWRSLELRVSLGAGDDTFAADLQVPSGKITVGVNAEAGNDTVTFRTVIDPNERTVIDPNERTVIDPNIRDVMLYASLGDGNDSFNGDLAFPPDPCRLIVTGGGGADSINALIGLLSNATPAAVSQGTIDVSLDGGDGNDVVRNTMSNVTLNGHALVNLQGGLGNDVVQQTLDMVTVNAGLDLFEYGGAGDDYVVLSNSPASRVTVDVTPTLFANSRVGLYLLGDAGNDRVIGLLQPCIMPAGSVSMIFSGGGGNDVISILLGLEAGLLNPPSDSNPASEHDGPIFLAAVGDDGDDLLNLSVRNLDHSMSPLSLVLRGGLGNDTAVVTPGIDASGWTN